MFLKSACGHSVFDFPCGRMWPVWAGIEAERLGTCGGPPAEYMRLEAPHEVGR